jgi:hypothetical protein
MNSFTPALVNSSASTYGITQTLTNAVSSNNIAVVASGSNFFATYTANSGFTLPSTVTVKSGSTTLVAGTGYLWNNTNGSLYIPNVTAAITITITAA